ncbi:MAG: pro-sigmaK processing inhibitor BofA family protein [Clostridia bacterium]|nr:pro-sigmaK processing inhibitor BofA family protein [Clostridia bacterium]
MEHGLSVFFSVLGAIILIYALKRIKVGYLILSALSGFSALFAADIVCSFFDLNLPVNFFSAAISAVGGIPGVILLNVLNAALL